MNSIVYNMDCMDGMKQHPDKYFDLAVVDPPYGNIDAIGLVNNKKRNTQATNRKKYKIFDNVHPDNVYYLELERISKNQIVWGGNFLGLCGGVIVWNKNGTAFGEAEVAICSTHKSVKIFEYTWNGMLQENMKDKEDRIHPTQKPVALYDWIYKNYLPNGGKVLDTHGGSMSNLIAALKAGNIEMHVYEIDKDYFKDAKQRVELFQSQGNLFAESQKIEWISF